MKFRVDFQSMLLFAFVMFVVLPALLPQDSPVSSASVLSVQTSPPSDNPNLPPTPQAGVSPVAENPARPLISWGSFLSGLLLGVIVGFVAGRALSGEVRPEQRTDNDRAA